MKQKAPHFPRFLLVAAIYIAGFVAAIFVDLMLNQAVYNPENTFAIIMESFGWYPVFLPALLLIALVITLPVKELGTPWLRYAAAGVYVAGIAALLYKAYGYWHERGKAESFFTAGNLVLFGAVALLPVALLLMASRLSPRARTSLMFVALWGSVFMVLDVGVVNVIKLVWGRTRFDDMAAMGSAFEEFTHWWRPFAGGGSSFPSGHTANAAGVFVLFIACDIYPTLAKHKKLVYTLCWVYVVLMAATRIIIGRHYLSDTLAASAIAAGLLYAVRHNKWYRRGLKSTKKKLTVLETR